MKKKIYKQVFFQTSEHSVKVSNKETEKIQLIFLFSLSYIRKKYEK
jgi:hypothetical protein